MSEKVCAKKGCTDLAVPNPSGKGRPTKYCLKHQVHKDRARKRLKKEGLITDSPPVNEDVARQLAVYLGMTNGDVKAATALAKLNVSGPELAALVERANSPDLKGLRDRTPVALGELFAGTAAIATLRAQASLPTMEPGEVLATIRTLEKAAERWGANEGKGSYAAITVVWPEHLFPNKKKCNSS